MNACRDRASSGLTRRLDGALAHGGCGAAALCAQRAVAESPLASSSAAAALSPGRRMKMLFAAVFATVLTPCASVHADSPKPSPLLGSWAVDVSRLPKPPQERPKSVTLTFGEAGNGKWSAKVDIVEQGGGKMHAEGVAALDGRATPVKNNFEADTFALQTPAPSVLVMMLAKDRSVASTRIYTVATDGRSMTETVAAFAPDGSPTMRTNYFTRVPSPAAPPRR
ncbi:hypothetical protein [Xanthomonas translucens]|uniref:hypothetical protein n=2 Tax=Xanthomonas campestris pv. translucens TaxID=343 RepID=UPI001E2ED82A|nr:hypothetical protein [Xanthomonas translucens]